LYKKKEKRSQFISGSKFKYFRLIIHRGMCLSTAF